MEAGDDDPTADLRGETVGRKGIGMTVIVCGDRNWNRKGIIMRALIQCGAEHIIHGGCRGADTLAGEIAVYLDIKQTCCLADWETHGLAAGPIRNRYMLTYKPDLVIAFHDNIDKSKGTKDMVKAAREAGVPVRIVGAEGK